MRVCTVNCYAAGNEVPFVVGADFSSVLLNVARDVARVQVAIFQRETTTWQQNEPFFWTIFWTFHENDLSMKEILFSLYKNSRTYGCNL